MLGAKGIVLGYNTDWCNTLFLKISHDRVSPNNFTKISFLKIINWRKMYSFAAILFFPF